MKKDITLVILAAGMGSRFGGLKQITPMGPHNEFIIDYSIYDAIKAGFNKVVFLIKKENYDIFRETIGARVENFIDTKYCFQTNDNIMIDIPKNRKKPFGTAHAIMCVKDKVNEPFMIINADDFYGRDAFYKASDFLKNTIKDDKFGMIVYNAQNTLTENGSVKRGVCKIKNDKLIKITESSVEKTDKGIIASPLNGSKPFIINDDTFVSMNMLLFTPSIFKYLEERFPKYLNENKKNLDTFEYLIPDVLLELINEGLISTDTIKTSSNWYGVTYKEDTKQVQKALKEKHLNKEYPNTLWNNRKVKILKKVI